LRAHLGVSTMRLGAWLSGVGEPPPHVFLRAVDLLHFFQLAQMSEGKAPDAENGSNRFTT
jgi:hypothetical protein